MKHYLDLKYSNESLSQKLDLYLPDTVEGPYPLILFIHGGGWQFGDKRDGQHHSWMHLVERGYALASINYRMFPESKFPEGFLDCKKALNFLNEKSEDLNLDMDRVGVAGNSAGGYYALMLAVTVDNPRFNVGSKDVPIQCCVVWYAPTDFYHGKEEIFSSPMNRIRYGLGLGFIEKLFGQNYDQIKDQELIEASPVTYIDMKIPPVLFQQGDIDIINPPSQAEFFIRAAKEKGVAENVIVEIFNEAGHVDPVFDHRSNKIRIEQFLNKYLKTKKTE